MGVYYSLFNGTFIHGLTQPVTSHHGESLAMEVNFILGDTVLVGGLLWPGKMSSQMIEVLSILKLWEETFFSAPQK